jgi:hypothetical protein
VAEIGNFIADRLAKSMTSDEARMLAAVGDRIFAMERVD